MRTIKSLFMVLVAVLLSVSIASAAGSTTADGSTIIRPAITDGVITAVVFNDTTVGTSTYSHWSNPVDISNFDFTRGSNRNIAYFTVGVAHANTATSGDITATYQISVDGKNFYSPTGAYNYGMLGMFSQTSSNGFDVGQGDAIPGGMCVAPSIAYGAGPYCATKTKVLELTCTVAKYIRFKVKGIAETTFDMWLSGASRQIEAD